MNMMVLAILAYGAIIFAVLTYFVCGGVFSDEDKAQQSKSRRNTPPDTSTASRSGDLPDIVAPRRRHGTVPAFGLDREL